MKVLHINEYLERKGGVETYLLSLLPLLRKEGVEAEWVYESGDATLWAEAHQVEGLGAVGFGAEAVVRDRVRDALERRAPDVVHVHNVQNVGVLEAALDYGHAVLTTHDYRGACPANSFYYRRTQKVCQKDGAGPACFAITAVCHCLTPRPQFAAYYYHRARWMQAHAHRFDRVIAPSDGAAERFRRAGYPPGRVRVLPYFCPVEPAARPRTLPATPTLTYMGRIAPNKGYETFVEALGQLPGTVQGVMVGNFSGDVSAAMRALAARYGCEERLALRPWASREEVRQVLDQTSVFVFPSLWPETLGIVGLEALARGVPVIASDVGGVREWLLDGETGRLVPPGDAGAIRDAALDMLASAHRLEAMGARGIQHIRDRFLPEQHTEALVRIYEEARDG